MHTTRQSTHPIDDPSRATMKSLARDMAELRFDGTCITGKNGLVSADVTTGKLEFRRTAKGQPFYAALIPATRRSDSVEKLVQTLTAPALRGWAGWDALDDLTSVLMAYFEWTGLRSGTKN
jgi:hypothetical protein